MADVAALVKEGERLANAQQWAEAERSLRQAVLLAPQDPNANYLLGLVLRFLARHEDSVTHLRRAADLVPGLAVVHNALGSSLRAASRFDEAEKAFLRAIELDPNLGEARYNLGRLHGEAISYHRAEDIRMGQFGRLTLLPTKDIVYSDHGEQRIIADILARLPDLERHCVDIGAGDGLTMSNSFPLFRDGWSGLAVEAEPVRYVDLAYVHRETKGRVVLVRSYATVENVADLLAVHGTPRRFGFLTLDIDSYDYFVMEALLAQYQPRLICVEINERIPPPVRYALRPGGEPSIIAGGASISAFEDLFSRFGYRIVKLEYNNLFCVTEADLAALAPHYRALSGETAWREGYFARPDRKIRFPWNNAFEELICAGPDDAKAYLARTLASQAPHILLETAPGAAAPVEPGAVEQATALFREGDFVGAIARCDAGLAAMPNDPGLLLVRGAALNQAGRAAEALETLYKAVRAAPMAPPAYYNLAVALAAAGRQKEAASALQQALVLGPFSARGRSPAWTAVPQGWELDTGIAMPAAFPAQAVI